MLQEATNYLVDEMQGKIDSLTSTMQWLLAGKGLQQPKPKDPAKMTFHGVWKYGTGSDEGKDKGDGSRH